MKVIWLVKLPVLCVDGLHRAEPRTLPHILPPTTKQLMGIQIGVHDRDYTTRELAFTFDYGTVSRKRRCPLRRNQVDT